MVQGLAQDKTATSEKGVWIPEFGVVNLDYINPKSRYVGKLFRLTGEQTRALSEITGFTARFDNQPIRTAYMDICQTEGWVIFEVERNTKPTDVNVRFMGDRWSISDVFGKGTDGLRPWIKTEYFAKYIPEKLLETIAEQLGITSKNIADFYIRLNFKDRIFGLIIEAQHADAFPTGAFSVFSLPQAGVMVAPVYEGEILPPQAQPELSNITASRSSEMKDEANGQSQDPESGSVESSNSEQPISAKNEGLSLPKTDKERLAQFIRPKESLPQPPVTSRSDYAGYGQAKYATYSKSEVDAMFKQHAESLVSQLSGKLSSHQRSFVETVESQQKLFQKMSDNFNAHFDAARSKLEGITSSSQEGTKNELAEFKRDLAKELEHYRAQINKSILPVAKILEEKPIKHQSAEKPAAGKQSQVDTRILETMKKLTIANIIALVIGLITIINIHLSQMAEITAAKQSIEALNQKSDTTTTAH